MNITTVPSPRSVDDESDDDDDDDDVNDDGDDDDNDNDDDGDDDDNDNDDDADDDEHAIFASALTPKSGFWVGTFSFPAPLSILIFLAGMRLIASEACNLFAAAPSCAASKIAFAAASPSTTACAFSAYSTPVGSCISKRSCTRMVVGFDTALFARASPPAVQPVAVTSAAAVH